MREFIYIYPLYILHFSYDSAVLIAFSEREENVLRFSCSWPSACWAGSGVWRPVRPSSDASRARADFGKPSTIERSPF